jgi:hypothetical protein
MKIVNKLLKLAKDTFNQEISSGYVIIGYNVYYKYFIYSTKINDKVWWKVDLDNCQYYSFDSELYLSKIYYSKRDALRAIADNLKIQIENLQKTLEKRLNDLKSLND